MIEYNNIQWLESWGINKEDNEKNLKKIENRGSGLFCAGTRQGVASAEYRARFLPP
jgi:hypothetical protein